MSDGSSSTGSSPRRLRSRSPGSDTESVAPSSWPPSSNTFNPSSTQPVDSSNAALLRQPVGFGASPASAQAYSMHTPASHHYSPDPASYLREDRHSAVHSKSSKGKEREKLREKHKDSSRKGKERDKGTPHPPAAHPSYPYYPPGHPTPATPLQRTAFRVRSYTNDPNATGSPPTIQGGPYGANYRVHLGGRGDNGHSSSSTPQSNQRRSQQRAEQAQPAADLQPRSSYYRHDYDKVRESAPANRAKAAVKAADATPSPHPQSASSAQTYSYQPPAPAPNPEPDRTKSRSKRRKDTHTYPTDHGYPLPQHDYDYGDTYDPPPSSYYEATPPPAPPQYSQHQYQQAEYLDQPAPPREKRHKSRSHRHREEQPQYPPPVPPPAHIEHLPPPQTNVPAPAVRVCRVLTLLIEDKRNGDAESMLSEVRVQLKQVDSGDVGFWADAQEVTDELQKGPSRIDGAAKVYTLRGKYKQYFLRISVDGEQICQPANLKVAPDRTLEIFIEDNPPPRGTSLMPSSPPRLDRELLTPVTETDSMISPSPAPLLISSHKRTSKSSLFSADEFTSRSPSENKFDSREYEESLSSSRKRPRSTSVQSVDSHYSQPAQHSAYSPFTRRSPSVRASSVQSRAPSHSFQPPPPVQEEPEQLSPVSFLPDLSTVQSSQTQQQQQEMKASPTPAEKPSIVQVEHPPSPSKSTSSRSVSACSSGPSPSKKAKLSVPSPQRAEHSASPAPTTQPTAFPTSNARAPSGSASAFSQPSMSGFAAYANPSGSAKKTFPSTGGFAQYASSAFSLPTPQSDTTSRSTTTSTPQSNLALALAATTTVPSLSTVSQAPPSIPATVAPTAISMTPTLSGQAASELDNAVGKYIRAIISAEPEWDAFVQKRTRVLTMREQLGQYGYVQRVFDRFVGSATPPDLEGAGGVEISRAQVMRAFNLGLGWGEECLETLAMTALYGEGGARGEDGRVVRMLDEVPPITTGMQAKKYLALLRQVDAQWMAEHKEGALGGGGV